MRSQEKTFLFSFYPSIPLATSSFLLSLCPCALHLASPFSFFLLSRRNISCFARLDVERKRKRGIKRENAEVVAAQRRSYSSRILSQASPVQLVASASSSCSGSQCKSEPSGGRSSLWSAVWPFRGPARACQDITNAHRYPVDRTRGCRTCCVQSWFQPGHPDRRERAAVEPEAAGSREESKREPVTRERV